VAYTKSNCFTVCCSKISDIKHIKNIFESEELSQVSTVSKMETVQIDGNRKIKRILTYFNLDVIIAVGYRVNSFSATQFRI
jgi:hypothetical protein